MSSWGEFSLDKIGGKVLFVATVAFVFAAIPVFFQYGPTLEAWVNPVLKVQAKNVHIDRYFGEDGPHDRVVFESVGEKYRACPVDELFFRVYFDDTSEGVPAFNDQGRQLTAKTNIAKGKFSGSKIWVELPVEAYAFKEVFVRMHVFFRCHGLWDTVYSYGIKVTMPHDPRISTPVGVPET